MNKGVNVDELLNKINALENNGNVFFNKVINSLNNPYNVDDAQRDLDQIQKLYTTIREEFQRGLLLNVRVPKNDPALSSLEGTTGESLEDLTRACSDQINTTHIELEKIKKSTNFCLTRLIDHL